MLVRARLFAFLCTASLLSAAVAAPADGSSASTRAEAVVSKKGKKRKRCKKGYALKTVRVHGKKVKRCRKIRGKGKGKGAGGTGESGGTGEGGGSAPLFDPPGHKLEGNDAVPFLQKYLYDSTFSDCPAGWPNCAVEERYSHTSGGSFFYCRLTSTPGADIINGARAYQVQNAVVEADGSWTFNEVVDNYGSPSYYEWHVATDGAVSGAYQYNGVEQIGPLQYVSGARDCSY